MRLFRSPITPITTDLLRYVELVQPKRVLTLHGFAAEFARDLRDRGIEAWALSEQNQMELTLAGDDAVRAASRRPAPKRERNARSGARNRNSALSPKSAKRSPRLPPSSKRSDCLPNTCATSTPNNSPSPPFILPAKPFPQSDQRTLQAGWAVIYRALIAASEAERRGIAAHREQPRRRRQDRVRSARGPNHARTVLVRRIASNFSSICTKRADPLAKTELLQTRFAKALGARRPVRGQDSDRRSADRFARRPGRRSDRAAFDAPLDEVKEANMLLGDIGADRAARLARRTRTRGADALSSDQVHAGESGADGGSDLGTFCD